MTEPSLVEITEPDGPRKVIIEDDGRTGYAYLLVNERIVSEVWLYNVTPPITRPAWDNPDELPFQNRLELIDDGPVVRIDERIEVTCVWNALDVEIFVEGRLAARLRTGETPGQSVNVRTDGPLGRRLR